VRLAKSAPRTWVPILLRNKYNVLDVLREHIHQLQIIRDMRNMGDIGRMQVVLLRLHRHQRHSQRPVEALDGLLEKEREEQHIFDLAGGGFESTVRLAKSAPRTWVPILLRNKYNVLDVLREHYPPVADHAAHDRARRRRRVDGGHAAGQCHSEDPAVTFPPSADTGRRGEQAAVDYLRRAGFAILERNWRSGRYELDIVARRWDELHFIEVKTRRAGGLTTPEEAITPRTCAVIES